MTASASDSIWFTTQSGLFAGGDRAWEEVAAYRVPLSRFVERRFGWLSASDRDDLVQDVLVEIKETLAARHDRSRGKFRALLQTVVRRRVADLRRAKRPSSLDQEVAAPSDDDVDALDLEAGLLAAVADCRDRFTQGKEKDDDVLYALVDRIVHGLSSKEIARKSGASADQVARRLEKGRDAIFRALLARELELNPEQDSARLAAALAAFKETLRKPRESDAIVAKLGDRGLRLALGSFVERFRAALPRFDGDATASGQELRRGIAVILESA